MDAIAIGAAGMVSAANSFAQSAQRTVDGSGDPAQEVVSQISAQSDFQASAKVVQVSNEMMGALLDIKI
jgi:flagellar hook protein FlgE